MPGGKRSKRKGKEGKEEEWTEGGGRWNSTRLSLISYSSNKHVHHAIELVQGVWAHRNMQEMPSNNQIQPHSYTSLPFLLSFLVVYCCVLRNKHLTGTCFCGFFFYVVLFPLVLSFLSLSSLLTPWPPAGGPGGPPWFHSPPNPSP